MVRIIKSNNINPQLNPKIGLLYTRPGVLARQALISDPAIQTGWNLSGGSRKYLSHATADMSSFGLEVDQVALLSGPGTKKYIHKTMDMPVSTTFKGALGIGIIGFGGIKGIAPIISVTQARYHRYIVYVA